MKKEYAKGYLYEIFIAHLLKQNSFFQCKYNKDSKHEDNELNDTFKCGVVSKDGEIKGRGTKHQIDFTGIYSKNIPFVYPIRLLSECKYRTQRRIIKRSGRKIKLPPEFKAITKSFIREYIGVHKDISENYFSDDKEDKIRFLDIPIIFSAGGFNYEAEKLAWSHGINLVSHSEIPVLRDVLLGINYLVDNVPPEYYHQKKLFPVFKEMAKNLIEGNMNQNSEDANQLLSDFHRNILSRNHAEYSEEIEIARDGELNFINVEQERYVDNFTFNLDNLRVSRFPTFLFGTTEYGKLINLISYDDFPDELFTETDEATCKILYYEHENEGEERLAEDDVLRTFFIQMDDDTQNREFYFQGNKTMMGEGFDELPERDRTNSKLNFIKELSIIKEINGLTRIIKLKVEFGGNG